MASMRKKIMIEVDSSKNLFFEREGDNVHITIQETKTGGRTYHTKSEISVEMLNRVCSEMC